MVNPFGRKDAYGKENERKAKIIVKEPPKKMNPGCYKRLISCFSALDILWRGSGIVHTLK